MTAPLAPTPARERSATTILIVEGAVLAVLGAAAIAAPVFAGLATAILLGWVLVAVGILGLVSAFTTRPHTHFLWSIASGVIALVAGVVTLIYPLAGVVSLTLLMAAWLALDGVNSFMIGVHARKAHAGSAIWPMLMGVVDWLLAAFLVFLPTLGAAVAVGVVVGIDLILAGLALVAMGMALRRAGPLADRPRPATGF